MASLFEAVTERLKLVIATNATLEFEADLIRANAQRKCELLAEARRLEAEGESELADELRAHAKGIDLRRPASSAVHASNDLKDECQNALNGAQQEIEKPSELNPAAEPTEASVGQQAPTEESSESNTPPAESNDDANAEVEQPEQDAEETVTAQPPSAAEETEDETEDKPAGRGKGRKPKTAKR